MPLGTANVTFLYAQGAPVVGYGNVGSKALGKSTVCVEDANVAETLL